MKDWKYILYVSAAVLLFVLVKLFSPKQFDWAKTFSHEDKNPYGTYALSNLLHEIVQPGSITHSYQTIYELKDSLAANENIISIGSTFNPDREDTNTLLSHVSRGGSAFISAEDFRGAFADTLKLGVADYLFSEDGFSQQHDSTYLKFYSPRVDTIAEYWYRKNSIFIYFDNIDTSKTTIIARNDYQQPVTVRVQWGKGNLILNSTPLAFTNIYVLLGQNHKFVSQTLSYLPARPVYWTEYYHLGRMESSTPLRFVLSSEPLRWAYYITIAFILLFMIFESKRKQRIIPIINPLANTTLEFVTTIGNLYYQYPNHKNIAEKKIVFLLERIRTRYWLQTNQFDENFIQALAAKSGKSIESVRSLFKAITFIQSATGISAEQLMSLNSMIEEFNSP